MDFTVSSPPGPLFVSSLSGTAAAAEMAGGITSLAQLTWVANLAVYMPLFLPTQYVARRAFWANGSSAGAANVDIGLYTFSGEKVFSTGSTAKSGSSNMQFVTLATEILLPPGRYYMAYANDTSTASIVQGAAPTTARLTLGGVLQEASALPLPATMTPAVLANALYPIIGFTSTTS